MANAINNSTIFVDATGDLTPDNTRPVLRRVLVAVTAAGWEFVIRNDSATGTIKVKGKGGGSEGSVMELDPAGNAGIPLASTFNITVLTNCALILVGDWNTRV